MKTGWTEVFRNAETGPARISRDTDPRPADSAALARRGVHFKSIRSRQPVDGRTGSWVPDQHVKFGPTRQIRTLDGSAQTVNTDLVGR